MDKALSAEEALVLLSRFTIATQAQSRDTGACVYTAGSKTYCAQLSQENCDKLGGDFTAGGKCPGSTAT